MVAGKQPVLPEQLCFPQESGWQPWAQGWAAGAPWASVRLSWALLSCRARPQWADLHRSRTRSRANRPHGAVRERPEQLVC